jgi:UDP-glucose:(heptosyl)LPS alpha-1,3-glucosyltransferase
MRIALIILHLDPRRGGAERYTVDLAYALAGRGHEVTILASSIASIPDVPQESKTPQNPAAIKLHTRGLTRSAIYRSFLDSVDEHLLRHGYDIVHAMLPVRKCDVYHPHAGMAADALRRVSIFKRIQNVTNRRGVYANIETMLLEGPNPPVVIALSDYVKKSIRESYPDMKEEEIATLHNAVDLEKFFPHPSHHAGITNALIVAQDFERKGLEPTVRAMAQLPDAGFVLTVVGKQDPAPYKKLAAELKMSPRVRFEGAMQDVRVFFNTADFFVLPTKHDPCSLVVLESLAMGVPVITTVFNGASELMKDAEHGFILTDPGDVNALKEAMRELLEPHVRARMQKACLELRPQLSYAKHLDRLLAIYDHARRT